MGWKKGGEKEIIKFSTEPKRLIDMIRKALINGKQLDSVSGLFSPTGVVFSDLSKGVIGCECAYPPSYFKSYDVDEEKEILFKKDLLDALSKLGFGAEDVATLDVDEEKNCFHIVAGGKRWDPTLSEVSDTRVPFERHEVTGIGVLPTDESKPVVAQFVIGVDKLKTPDVEKVTLRINNDRTLSVELDLIGPFAEKFTPTQVRTMNAGAHTTFVNMLSDILANFVGEVWLTIYEKFIFVTQLSEDSSLMYLTSTT